MAALEPWADGRKPSNIAHHPATTAALNADIQSLVASKDRIDTHPLKTVFESVVAILTLVRDEMVEEVQFVEVAQLCSRACRMLETVTRERDVGIIDDLGRKIEELERIVRQIGSTVGEHASGADCAQDFPERPSGFNNERIVAWKAGLCEILNFFDGQLIQHSAAQSNVGSVDSELDSAPVLVMPTPALQNGEHLGFELGDTHSASESSITNTPDAGERALERLVVGTVPQDELPIVIETVVLHVKASHIVEHFRENDGAQSFIDMMDTAIDTFDLAPRIRRKCLKPLYKICANHTLLPASLHFELPVDIMGDAQYRGGSANVLRRQCGGQEVAVKALRPHGLTLEGMKNRFCKEVITWKSLQHPNVLPLLGVIMTDDSFAMISEWMPNGNIKEFIAADQDANRFELLADVAKGLLHMHSQGMIHGDLKGANILINSAGRACVADFGLLTIASDVTNVTSTNSFLQGGTCRWMSPELFDPEKFGLEDRRPTKCSDLYALGMVIYEVLSGRIPFPRDHDYVVVVKVLKGEHPSRPQGLEGVYFTEEIWDTLERCWRPSPGDRSRVVDVLHCLERVSGSWTSIPPQRIGDKTDSHPTTDLLPWSSDSNSGGSTDESEEPSPFHAALSQPSKRFPSKVILREGTDDQGVMSNISGLDPELSVEVSDNLRPPGRSSQETSLRRRITHLFRGDSTQPPFTSGERLSLGGPFVAAGVAGARETDDAETRGPHHLILKGTVGEKISGSVTARKGPRHPTAIYPLNRLTEVARQWATGGVFFFFDRPLGSRIMSNR